MKIEELLSSKHVPFSRIHHPEAFTSQEEAAAAHVAGDKLAKVVVVRAGDKYALAVCPATYRVDLSRLSEAVGAPVRLANESEMQGLFKDAELGAEPPFGDLYGLDTWVDGSLADQDEIVFDAGTHTDFIRMSYADFERIAKHKVARFAERR
jgi:Ala-tRNA(Pro) deacylase